MMVVVSYDVATSETGGTKRLRLVAKECVNYGQRVQNSVFECILDPAQFEEFKHKLLKIADLNVDSICFYFLGSNWKNKINHYGVKKKMDIDEPLIL
ncbi:MAG: CRISPR-associated endonuclease Cas2 [Epulopiscium sp.]|nr:CRISPR-associated endonuclease Cas2 [Candidatus Epulonipiscium sp.]